MCAKRTNTLTVSSQASRKVKKKKNKGKRGGGGRGRLEFTPKLGSTAPFNQTDGLEVSSHSSSTKKHPLFQEVIESMCNLLFRYQRQGMLKAIALP